MYETARSEPLPLEVVRSEAPTRAEEAAPRAQRGPARGDGERSPAGAPALPTWLLGLLGLFALAGVLGLVYRRTVSRAG